MKKWTIVCAVLSLVTWCGAKEILTPPAPDTPRINGPSVFGVRPNAPFLYAIPATGTRPMDFAVKGLPSGLTVDSKTGRITGRVSSAGEYTVTLGARNALGSDTKTFRIVVGDRIALTPPMGWSSWKLLGRCGESGKGAQLGAGHGGEGAESARMDLYQYR